MAYKTPQSTSTGTSRNRAKARVYSPQRDSYRRIQGMTFKELSDILHTGIGTDLFVVAVELLRGGKNPKEIAKRLQDVLPATTRNGTPKNFRVVVSNAKTTLERRGFTVVDTWVMTKLPK